MKNFILKKIKKKIKKNKKLKIKTRFPPEPNGHIHIGHAKAIYLNFEIAKKYNGNCNLRFDDTNPNKEKKNYVSSIKKDIKWLGYNWNKKSFYTSDYFSILYKYAKVLIKKKLAYVDRLSKKEIVQYRGTLKKKGCNSPYRKQKIKENLELFKKMKNGQFKEGEACLRAKINMSSSYVIMRDPVLYRIIYTPHYKTQNKWCIYPTYDFSHCISDAIENITHSLCTLEFQENRILYEWILKNINFKSTIKNPLPKQYEYSRLNLEYTVLSKRKLKILVKKKLVDGWKDPRMPTISGLKNRGYTATSIKSFCKKIGITKQKNLIEIKLLESCIKDELDIHAPRRMAVINPIKVTIINYPKKKKEILYAKNHPKNVLMGTRKIIFSRTIYIDTNDFKKNPKIGYKRLAIGREIRLRYAYIIKAVAIKKDKKNKIINIYCLYDKKSLGKNPKKKKPPQVIHWISSKNFYFAKFYIYKNLFLEKNPDIKKDFLFSFNKNSLHIKKGIIEKSVKKEKKKMRFQFEREGYFIKQNSNTKLMKFNRIVSLKKHKD